MSGEKILFLTKRGQKMSLNENGGDRKTISEIFIKCW